MSRINSRVQRRVVAPLNPHAPTVSDLRQPSRLLSRSNIPAEFWALRGFLLLCAVAICYTLRPLQLGGAASAALGVVMAAFILMTEMRLRRAEALALLGGVLGALAGVSAAVLFTLVISRTSQPEITKSFLACACLAACAYLGVMLGSEKGEELHLAIKGGPALLGTSATENPAVAESLKLLDTSVLIDGRIADICEAQFLDGILVVPQFVLHELQLVADSGDALKRQRGRRGLDVLERIRKMPGVEVRVMEKASPSAGEVDHKLIDLARQTGAKIVTNDFNLNKVATVQGLIVLNVNQLANALKTVVLPGEPMRVLILREGKEANQGVGYLDDGTMVVVDGAKRFTNRSVDIVVTSVHQTTAGKMIFGRIDDRAEFPGTMVRQTAGGSGRSDLASRGDPSVLNREVRSIYPESGTG